METSSSYKTFLGVHFVLFGFDPISQRQVRAKLVNGGGVDAGQYSQSCTHVIVDKIVYDDPLCVAARNDGKIVVTGLWVDHSYDIGMAVDATSIMYRPLRDLNGIPGAKSFIMCLTGYQRQDRDDIMTMVSLMGAQFSKPLVANRVTHLICYKFEGEKYELANKLKKIKLVNHRWLEDCLRDWELLPEDNYSKSGYELEMMEAEAKDSEEDAEDTNEKQSSHRTANKSPQLKVGTPKPCQSSRLNGEVPKMSRRLCELECLPSLANAQDILRSPSTKNKDNHTSSFHGNCLSEALACQDASTSKDAASVRLLDPQVRTPSSRKQGNDLESVSRSSERPHCDAKFSAASYTRKTPQRSPSIFSGKSGTTRGSPKTEFGESSNISSAKVECSKELFGSGPAEVLLKGSELPHKEALSSKKQKLDVSCSTPIHQNVICDAQIGVAGSPSVNSEIQGVEVEPVTLVNDLFKINNHFPPGNHDRSINNSVGLDDAQKLHTGVSTAESSEIKKKALTQSPQFLENETPVTEQSDSANTKKPETSFNELIKSSPASVSEGGDLGIEKSDEHVAVAAGCPWDQKQNIKVPTPCKRKSEMEKSQANANLEEFQEGNNNLMTKPVRKKTIAKKTLGSRPKFKSIANKKGSIFLNKAAAQNDAAIGVSGDIAGNKSYSANELETSAHTVNVTAVNDIDTRIGTNSGDDNGNGSNSMDDETEAPEDKDGSEDVFDAEKTDVAHLSHKVDDMMKIETDGAQHAANSNAAELDDDVRENNNATQLPHKDESTCKISAKGKVCKDRKQASVKTKTETNPVSKQAKSKKAMAKEKGKPVSAGHSKRRPVSARNSEMSVDVEKENKQIADGDQNTSKAKDDVEGVGKSDKVSMKNKQKSRKCNPNCTPAREVLKNLKTEPVLFIFGGHRLQRKEFQQVIRRLRGKFCRDSHQWSYQATHFIAPDPIRRTEKFFAAAASGRWILKTDYLTACSQAGKFLEEEPYEWYKNGLSEDGAINLEAPRKWRLLQEKTGHGALYSMRIIIYGECIAPPLDTLKRVVKAGGGTILATSPPYTRFLTSGVDYAIVSPGMPRVDMWVQEFIRHEIPCVVADYLVEYVCKPGYSLDRHVLYNTHAWAEKSFAKLSSKAEENVDDYTPSDDANNSDIACEVCGSRDREDVMLICGDEVGSVGCGVGMHLDCCDPPLKSIPDDDWFCPNCSRSSSSNSSKRRKGASSKSK